MAKKQLTDLDLDSNKVTNLGSGTSSGDAVNKGQLDGLQAETVTFVNHGATAGTARPTGFDTVMWLGSVEPTNAVNDDFWVDTT